MSNERPGGKRLIGAQASKELWAGVDAWLQKNPRLTVTDFVLSACLEKLKEEGIPVDENAALKDGRRRTPFYPRLRPSAAALNDAPNSTAAAVRDQMLAGGGKTSYRRRPSKKSSAAKRPALVVPSKP